MRLALGVPNTTHRYLIESLSGCLHAKTMLYSRLVKLRDTMISSNKPSVKLLSYLVQGDHRTVMGMNLASIQRELNTDNISPVVVKKNMKYFPPPEDQAWRIHFIKELLEARTGKVKIDNIETDDIKNMIDLLCTT